jgi:hypothetical protein
MVNYKIVNDNQMIEMESWTNPGHPSGYVERGGDILEVKTDQIIKSGLPLRKAKELCRHLNFGGGFDGFTPSFFLAK